MWGEARSTRPWQGNCGKQPPDTLYLSSSCLGPRLHFFGQDLLLIENGSAWLAVPSFQSLPRRCRKKAKEVKCGGELNHKHQMIHRDKQLRRCKGHCALPHFCNEQGIGDDWESGHYQRCNLSSSPGWLRAHHCICAETEAQKSYSVCQGHFSWEGADFLGAISRSPTTAPISRRLCAW